MPGLTHAYATSNARTGVNALGATAAARTGLPRQPSLPQRALRFAARKPLGAIGAALVVLLVAVAAFGAWIAPYDPSEAHYDALFAAPGPRYLLGTDNFGRDVLSRVIHGARVSLYVGLLSVILGTTSGAALGLVSAYFGGRVDAAIQRVMDVLMTFPTLILALAVVAALGPSVNNVVIAVAIVQIPRASRVVRSAALGVKGRQYIEAARAIGAADARILVRHMAPNCIAPYVIIATADIATAILTEASLSFLGLGPPPPAPTWGGMLTGASRQFLQRAPWMAIYPGLAISLAVFAFNLLGDAVRDIFDPRLKGAK